MQPVDTSKLDTTIHGPARLGILAALSIDRTLDFSTLKKRLRITDGALGVHLQKLEEADFIQSTKAFVNKRPQTTYRLTRHGRRAFAAYLDQMQQLLDTLRPKKRE